MRLIDADLLLEHIERSRANNPHEDPKIASNHEQEHRSFIYAINSQPTAFDPENIIDQIRAVSEKTATARSPHLYYKSVSVRKATEIIRGGVCNGSTGDPK